MPGPRAIGRSRSVAATRRATVLLGHTRDDQAETVLLGLARGSGTRSLAGMATRTGPGGRWLRPLLGVARAVTEQACLENDLVPWRDPHNTDPSFARVRVRQTVLPTLEAELGPGISGGAGPDRGARPGRRRSARRAGRGGGPGDGRDWSASVLDGLPAALRRRVIGRWLRLEHGLGDLSAGHLYAVEALVTDWHGQARGGPARGSARTAARMAGWSVASTTPLSLLGDVAPAVQGT